MDAADIDSKRDAEEEMLSLLNKLRGSRAQKARLPVGSGGANHEFDIYYPGKIIGGITTSPWKNRTGSNNSGGQDRASTELLWLTQWKGGEERVMILSDSEMALSLWQRWRGYPFNHRIEIIHCDLSEKKVQLVGELGDRGQG